MSNLKSLDIGCNHLTSIPIELAECREIKELSLYRNRLTEIPKEIFSLPKVSFLDLGGNRLQDIPVEISNLDFLSCLSLSYNILEKIPEGISHISTLESLTLSGNKIESLPTDLFELSKLRNLKLWKVGLKNISPRIGLLESLEKLFLGSNEVSFVPQEIGSLKDIKVLDLSGNNLYELPAELGNLRKLSYLDLRRNRLSRVPSWIKSLENLEEVDISGNQICILPEFIQHCKSLRTLHLSGNPIHIAPELLVGREPWAAGDLKTILQLAFTPPNETPSITEAKLLIVGESGAGKTSLANKLQDPGYELQPEEKSTEGIDLIRWEIDYDPETKLRTNIWDFGGQQIYHSTHQFFLTERAVYILVADTRKENTDFYYWLSIVEILSNSSPVIIVKNEKQDRQCDLDERSLRAEFPNLKEIHAVNLADNRGLEELQTLVRFYLCNLPHIGSNVSIPWANIRAVLENLSQNQNFITRDRYFELCRNNGFDDEKDMLAASKFLHDLGICLHFQKVRGLRKLIILNPTWATGSIYKILDNREIKANFGRFDERDLETIWNEGDAAKMRDELLDLMMHFGLCYEIPHCKGRYISPQLLEKESCNYDWDDTENLILRYEYEFKPKDIFPRFVVAIHEYIERQCLVWRHGVILRDRSARAEIIEEDRYHKATIRIRVSGHHKRDLLTYIARELEQISNTYDRIDYETYIPCNCDTCKHSTEPHTYTWENLRRRLQHKQYEVQCDISYKMVNVRSLLDDIAAPMLPSSSDELDNSGLERDRYGDPTGRSSPFSSSVVINNYPSQVNTMTNTGRTINTGGGAYNEVNNSGQYAGGNIVNGGTSITQHHGGSGDNVAGDKNVTTYNNPSPAETAELLKTLLADLDLSATSESGDFKDEILYQSSEKQNQWWQWMRAVADSDTRDEAVKAAIEVVGSMLGVPGAVAAGFLKVGYTALMTKRQKQAALLPSEAENPFEVVER